MRVLLLIGLFAVPVFAQDLDITIRPGVVYIETFGGNVVPMDRVFFHIVIENKQAAPVQMEWVKFDITNAEGALLSGQYSGNALIDLFDASVDRRRIEPTPKKTLELRPGERKAISDIFIDLPRGFIGENIVVEAMYKAGNKSASQKASVQLQRTQGFLGRLPFDGTWYVAAEHGFLDAHKRFLAEAFAYDFLQIGLNGKSYQRDGKTNADYFAYGKKVLAAKEGTVVNLRGDMAENVPGQTTNVEAPGGNFVVIDHGNSQFGYYAHLKPFSVVVKIGTRVKVGDILGEVGNSGDSTEPHLHFHVMNAPDPTQADGTPLLFENWKGQSFNRLPVARQGIIPRGEFVQP